MARLGTFFTDGFRRFVATAGFGSAEVASVEKESLMARFGSLSTRVWFLYFLENPQNSANVKGEF
jgi:hypothetical protein